MWKGLGSGKELQVFGFTPLHDFGEGDGLGVSGIGVGIAGGSVVRRSEAGVG